MEADVWDRNGLISEILDVTAQFAQNNGAINLIDPRVAHCRVVAKIGPLLNSSEISSRNTEGQNDARFGIRENISRIHLLGRSLKSVHRGKSAQVRANSFSITSD